MLPLASDYGLARRLSQGPRRAAEVLTWYRELDRLDHSCREVGRGRAQSRSGNQQVTEVPTPRSLSA